MKYKRIPLPMPDQNNPEIRAYVKAVKAGEKMYYLFLEEGDWIVKKAMSKKALKIFDKKAKAQLYAEKLAKKDKTEVIIFKTDGGIQKRISYLSDRLVPKA